MLQNLKTLGLNDFGAPAEVDKDHFPFHHARILFTSYPALTISGPGSPEAQIAHSSVINTKNSARWKDVWTYMLTETEKDTAP